MKKNKTTSDDEIQPGQWVLCSRYSRSVFSGFRVLRYVGVVTFISTNKKEVYLQRELFLQLSDRSWVKYIFRHQDGGEFGFRLKYSVIRKLSDKEVLLVAI